MRAVVVGGKCGKDLIDINEQTMSLFLKLKIH